MKKEITGSIPESTATHAEILWYKTNENACNCRLFIMEDPVETTVVGEDIETITVDEDGVETTVITPGVESTITTVPETTLVNGRVYRINNLPFELTSQEIAYLTGSKPDETWPEELTQEFLDKNRLEEIPEEWTNSYDPGQAPTTEQLKAAINQKYESLKRAGCMTSLGFRIDCMDNNIADFDQSITLLNLSGAEEIIVRDYDNVNHVVSVADYKQICLELGAHIMSLRQQRWAEIDNLTA